MRLTSVYTSRHAARLDPPADVGDHLSLRQRLACESPDLYEKEPIVTQHPRRYASIIGLRADKLAEYKNLHAAVWPGVLSMIRQCNIRNYSIFLRKVDHGRHYLFSYFEYTGADFDADMKKMADDPTTRTWWDFCKPCQMPLNDRAGGEWWAAAQEVFHVD